MLEKFGSFREMRLASALMGLIMVGIGIFLLFHHMFIVPLFAMAVGLSGALLIIKYLLAGKSRNGWDLITGILYIVFGFYMLTTDTATKFFGVIAMEYFLMIWIAVSACMNIGASISRKREKKSWIWMLIGSILSIIFCLVFMYSPVLSALIVTDFLGILGGITLMFMGLTMLASALSGKDLGKKDQDKASE